MRTSYQKKILELTTQKDDLVKQIKNIPHDDYSKEKLTDESKLELELDKLNQTIEAMNDIKFKTNLQTEIQTQVSNKKTQDEVMNLMLKSDDNNTSLTHFIKSNLTNKNYNKHLKEFVENIVNTVDTTNKIKAKHIMLNIAGFTSAIFGVISAAGAVAVVKTAATTTSILPAIATLGSAASILAITSGGFFIIAALLFIAGLALKTYLNKNKPKTPAKS